MEDIIFFLERLKNDSERSLAMYRKFDSNAYNKDFRDEALKQIEFHSKLSRTLTKSIQLVKGEVTSRESLIDFLTWYHSSENHQHELTIEQTIDFYLKSKDNEQK